jgi:hypothetical protein
MIQGAVVLLRAFVLGAFVCCATVPNAIAQNVLDKAKLDAFVTAALAVETVMGKWSPRIAGAADDREASMLHEQAVSELTGVVENTAGITVEEYRDIARAAKNDTTLNAEIMEIRDRKAGD